MGTIWDYGFFSGLILRVFSVDITQVCLEDFKRGTNHEYVFGVKFWEFLKKRVAEGSSEIDKNCMRTVLDIVKGLKAKSFYKLLEEMPQHLGL